MADFIATAPLSFGAANTIAGLLVNPVGSNKTATIRGLAGMPTNGHIPNVTLRRMTGVTATPIQGTTPPPAYRVASTSVSAHAIPTTSQDHTYIGGVTNLEVALGLYGQLETAIVVDAGEALAVVMLEDGTGVTALFAVEWSEP